MKETILRILGFDMDQIPPGADWTFTWTFQDVLQSWRVFAFIALVAILVYLIFFVYRRENSAAPSKARTFLGVVRALVIIVLALIILGPAIRIEEKKKRQDVVLVLLDESLSMLAEDRYLSDEAVVNVALLTGKDPDQVRADRPNRAELINYILQHQDNKLVRDLAEQGEVQVAMFSGKLGAIHTIAYAGADQEAKQQAVKQAEPKSNWIEYAVLENPLPLACVFAAAALFFLYSQVRMPSGTNLTGVILMAATAGGVMLLGYLVETPREEYLANPDTYQREQPPPTEDEQDQDEIPQIVLSPTGQGTNLSSAVRKVIESVPGRPIAAIVLITDGQNTAREDDPGAAAEFAADKNIPIIALGVGDPSRKRNLRISQASANETVRKNNPFQVDGEVQAEGLPATTVKVDLVATKMPGGGDGENVLASKTVSLDGSEGDEGGAGAVTAEKLSFEYTPQQPGEYEFYVRVQLVDGESDEYDNLSKPINVKVRSDKARILLVSGSPTWEYRSLRPLLQRDSDVDVSVWLQSLDPTMKQDGNTVIDHLPATPRELFEYDAVVMLDPDPKEFAEVWIENLRTFLGEHGGGLLYMPGPKHATSFLGGIRTADFRDLLPVRFGDMGALDVKTLIAQHTKEWPLVLVPANLDHPVMKFDTTNPQFNEAVWTAMPGIFWSFPALEAKPGARVMLEHSNPAYRTHEGRRPLLATGLYGPGRICYIGFNGTWRFRSIGADAEFYEKFWMQTIHFLIQGRDQRGSKRGYIDLPGAAFNVGDRINVQARLYDPGYAPLEDQTVEAVIRVGDDVLPLTFEKKPGEPGMYQAVINAAKLGTHRIEIELPGLAGGKPEIISAGFDIALPRVEMEVTRLNKPLLRTMAETHKEGGYFEVDQWREIPAAVPDRSQTIVVARKPIELWATDRLLIVLVFLLTIEWACRKKFKLM